MGRTVVIGALVLALGAAAHAATIRSYYDVGGEEWRACQDEHGYVVRHVESGDTQTWGSGYSWADIEDGHRLVPPPFQTEDRAGDCDGDISYGDRRQR